MEEQLAGTKPKSQFGQAVGALGVELIAAHSPQAKGRVERLFQTFQDRVRKEMRLAKVATIEAANQFLAAYLPRYNQQFTVLPSQAVDLHRPTPTDRTLDASLCIKTRRCLRKEFTITYQGTLYQIHDTIRATHVQVEHRLDGTMRFTHHGRALACHVIAARPGLVAEAEPLPRAHRPVTPKRTHPWRKRWPQEHGAHPAAAGT